MSEFSKVSKVLLESNGIYFIECPGCKYLHPLHVGPQHKIRWDFDGNLGTAKIVFSQLPLHFNIKIHHVGGFGQFRCLLT